MVTWPRAANQLPDGFRLESILLHKLTLMLSLMLTLMLTLPVVWISSVRRILVPVAVDAFISGELRLRTSLLSSLLFLFTGGLCCRTWMDRSEEKE